MDWTANLASLTPPWTPGGALVALAAVLVWGWVRERRNLARHRAVQRLYGLGEELIASPSFAESVRLLQTVLPEVLRITEVQVHVLDRGCGTIQRVELTTASGSAPILTLLEEPAGFLKSAVEMCYRNRSSIAVSDTRRNPLMDATQGQPAPRSAMFLPMFAQGEALGVLALGDASRTRQFTEEERAVAQHLANQLAIGLRLLEQKSLRGQAVGGDRLDAMYHLISTAAGELDQITREAPQAAPGLSRILRFIRLSQENERPVDLAGLLRSLVKLREKSWEERGLQVRHVVAPEPLFVASRSGTLEQTFLSLLWHAEQSLEGPGERTITLRAFRLAAMAQVDITWPSPHLEAAGFGDGRDASSEDVYTFGQCQDLVRIHGGSLRLASSADQAARIEVELPLMAPEVMGSAASLRATRKPAAPFTALVLEPDPEARQALVSALADSGHRSVTAQNADEARELLQRLRFDILFCSSHLPGDGWPACFESSRSHVRFFVVLTRGHEPSLAAALPAGEAWTLAKPVCADEFRRLLADLEARAAADQR